MTKESLPSDKVDTKPKQTKPELLRMQNLAGRSLSSPKRASEKPISTDYSEDTKRVRDRIAGSGEEQAQQLQEKADQMGKAVDSIPEDADEE